MENFHLEYVTSHRNEFTDIAHTTFCSIKLWRPLGTPSMYPKNLDIMCSVEDLPECIVVKSYRLSAFRSGLSNTEKMEKMADIANKEFEIIKRLRDEFFVINIYGFVRLNGYIMGILIEYCENSDVRKLLDLGGVRLIMKIKWMKQLSEAVGVLQKKYGIIHGDIKCANLLLDTNYDIKLCDFHGSVYEAHHNRGELVKSWTHPFASPEVFLEDDVTFKSEIYSLGVTFFEMFYDPQGYREHDKNYGFRNLDAIKIRLLKYAEQFRRYASKFKSGLGTLDSLISKCLHEDPFERPDIDYVISEIGQLLKDVLVREDFL